MTFLAHAASETVFRLSAAPDLMSLLYSSYEKLAIAALYTVVRVTSPLRLRVLIFRWTELIFLCSLSSY